MLEQLGFTLTSTHRSRSRIPAPTAARVLRGERLRLDPLARRADRAMRTYAARHLATSAYATIAAVIKSGARASGDEHYHGLFLTLASRPGWSRRSVHVFVRTFGSRQTVVTLPARLELPLVAALIARAEINAVLGDTDWRFLSELQALASAELGHLR